MADIRFIKPFQKDGWATNWPDWCYTPRAIAAATKSIPDEYSPEDLQALHRWAGKVQSEHLVVELSDQFGRSAQAMILATDAKVVLVQPEYDIKKSPVNQYLQEFVRADQALIMRGSVTSAYTPALLSLATARAPWGMVYIDLEPKYRIIKATCEHFLPGIVSGGIFAIRNYRRAYSEVPQEQFRRFIEGVHEELFDRGKYASQFTPVEWTGSILFMRKK